MLYIKTPVTNQEESGRVILLLIIGCLVYNHPLKKKNYSKILDNANLGFISEEILKRRVLIGRIGIHLYSKKHSEQLQRTFEILFIQIFKFCMRGKDIFLPCGQTNMCNTCLHMETVSGRTCMN